MFHNKGEQNQKWPPHPPLTCTAAYGGWSWSKDVWRAPRQKVCTVRGMLLVPAPKTFESLIGLMPWARSKKAIVRCMCEGPRVLPHCCPTSILLH